MELASSAQKHVNSVTIISSTSVPFENIFGKEVGAGIMHWYETKGVKFELKTKVKQWIYDDDGLVKAVTLDSDKTLTADEYICGIGTVNTTDWLKPSGLKLAARSFAIEVDEHCRTNLPDVYAAGDCTEFPLKIFNTRSSVLHWQMGHHLGKVAGQNIAGKQPCTIGNIIPFFWTANFNKSLRFAGFTHGYKSVHIDGDVKALKFIAWYLDDADRVLGLATFGMDPVAARWAEIMYTGKQWVTKDIVQSDPKLENLAKQVFSDLAKGDN